MKNTTIIIAVLTLIIIAGASFGIYKMIIEKKEKVETVKADELYICPMHPQIQSNHPGICPICQMDLVLKESSGAQEEFESYKNSGKELGDVVLSPSEQVLANVKTEIVTIQEFKSSLEFNGFIKTDESSMRRIATPVGGKIVRLYINFEGQNVSRGQKVFDIYSPEIYSTQKEYLLAVKNYENARSSNNELVMAQAENLISATRTRLSLWEITPEQIEELESTGEVKDYVSVYSKYSGVVMKKLFNEGHWATAGEDILDVADMSTVWVIASVPESDIGNIKMGQSAKITSVSYPDEIFYAKVNFISPVISPDSRTLEVRFNVSNRNYRLKPDMFVKAEVGSAGYQWNMVVPRNAILRTGKMDMVYVKKGKNLFSPRRVTIGGEQDGRYLITSGLKEGEEIVTSAGFLIDSESQIRTGTSTSNMESMEMEVKGDPEFNKDQDIMKDMKQHKR
ncbi:MAG TPA: efflux RND transporter periplasmic adaptor subunit [Ignavibacteria bacterium]|nr:efflux RND transporter periplasmic adaptor subunit [Ignavibacteria bacterium]